MDWMSWAQTFALIITAFTGVRMLQSSNTALQQTLEQNAELNRKTSTLNHIIHQKRDRDLLRCIDDVYALHDKQQKENFCLTEYLKDRKSRQCKAILKVLNNHEVIALGIRIGTFDEETYKQLQYSNIMKVHDASAPFIAELRRAENRKTLFQEFEWLVKRWEKSPIKQHN